MNRKHLTIIIGGVLAFSAGSIWGVAKKQPAEARCSILLQPKLSDAKGALAELAGDMGSPIMVLKGTIESHSSLSKISAASGVKEKLLETQLQVKPVAKEMRIELEFKNPSSDVALNVLRSTLSVLEAESLRLSESFGDQQARNLKSLINQRTIELQKATSALATYQKNLQSSLDPVKARQAVVTLEQKYNSAKQRLDTYLKQQETRLANPELGDWSPTLQALRLAKQKAREELNIALIKFGDENPEVVSLRKAVRIAEEAFNAEVTRLRASEEKNLQTQSAAYRASANELERQLKFAKTNERNAADESLKLAFLKGEADTIALVLKGLRTAYEQARITGAGSPGTWAVLDAPYVAPEPTLSEKILKYGGFALFGYLAIVVLTVVLRFASSQRGKSFEE